MATLANYLEAAMHEASFEKLEDGSWFASIPALAGLWGAGPTRAAARDDLRDALPGWIKVHTKAGNHVPDLKGVRWSNPRKKVA